MRSMKSSIYRYARRQAKRDFNRAYYQYRNGSNGNRNLNAGKNTNANAELSDKDIIIGACVVIGVLFFTAFMLSL